MPSQTINIHYHNKGSEYSEKLQETADTGSKDKSLFFDVYKLARTH